MTEDDPHDTVFPLPFYFVLAALFLFGCPSVNAEPIFQTTSPEGTVITLYSDPCTLKNTVINLPHKAVWEEKGKTFEGCWRLSNFGNVLFYFDDKTVGDIPPEAFRRVVGV